MIWILNIIGLLIVSAIVIGGLAAIGYCVWKHVEDAYEAMEKEDTLSM